VEAAVALGKLGGAKGGPARAKKVVEEGAGRDREEGAAKRWGSKSGK